MNLKNIKIISPLSFKNPIKKIREEARLRNDFAKFKEMPEKIAGRFTLQWEDRRLIYEDTHETSFDTHYIYHPAWAARILAQTKPQLHIDISSILSFSTTISAFIPVQFYDYRPANIKLDNFSAGKADLLSLPFADDSVESLSCMHTIEHIGLGRYGDNIDPDGDIKAINELKRVTAKNGNLLFVVPIGKPKVVFNAHRIYSYSQILDYFNSFELKDFFLIPDDALKNGPIKNGTREDADRQDYGCGCFWFKKTK